MSRLEKVIEQAQGLVQLLERVAEEEDRQRLADEKKSQQCTNCDEMLVGSRQTSIAEGLCNGCWDNAHPMHRRRSPWAGELGG